MARLVTVPLDAVPSSSAAAVRLLLPHPSLSGCRAIYSHTRSDRRERKRNDPRNSALGWEGAVQHLFVINGFCLRFFPFGFPFFVYSQPEVDERVHRLEGDKDSLQMQVSILMDQIEAQTDKIADLERSLSDRACQLQRSEEALQKVCATAVQGCFFASGNVRLRDKKDWRIFFSGKIQHILTTI